MKRRDFLKQTTSGIFGAMLGFSCRASAGQALSKPNILLVIYDDQSWRECSAYGCSSVQTPNFDRVARDGVLFNYAYCSAPSCAPSRAALLTGRNFWELEQGAFIQAWLPSKYSVLPDLLETVGYYAGYTGKGWGPGLLPESGRKRNPAGDIFNDVKIKAPPDGVSNIDYAANFSKFLDSRPKGKPFYFWAGLFEPHHPHGKDNYKQPGMDPSSAKLPAFTPDTAGVRRYRTNYLWEVQHADNTLGQLLELLEERGELAHTLVIVTADNGTPTPRAKANVYDWGVRMPLAMMWPGRIKSGRKVDDFVNFIDLSPTILDAAGISVPKEMSGRSALNVLFAAGSGRVDGSRDCTFAGLEWHGEQPPCNQSSRMVRDERFQYIVNYGTGPRMTLNSKHQRPDSEYEKSAETLDVAALLSAHQDHPKVNRFIPLIQGARPHEELYDCVADPDELINLADKPEFVAVKEKLRARLEAYQRSTKDPRITGDMELFEKTRAFVIDRKSKGYH
ncbi:MAG: hypothetical protein A2283_12300 [Lentisphaerae bacterium RIFOXYA12_FULL_48_11]|nr:MAG: hypothetical protein A2283_12300 [Lentisphaerae bacterium RIFOXYA12_FULL_48_11]